jgi:hypothetical protein
MFTNPITSKLMISRLSEEDDFQNKLYTKNNSLFEQLKMIKNSFQPRNFFYHVYQGNDTLRRYMNI